MPGQMANYSCKCLVLYGHFAEPHMAKLSRGKAFAVVHKTHYSLENFRGASDPCHCVLYTASDSTGKLSRLAKSRESFPVYGN